MNKKFILLILALLCSAVLAAGESYNVMMISDTHFGSEASFGPNPPAKVQKKLKRCDQAVPNFRAMFSHMVKTSDQATKFLIHAGDIIEGYGFNAEAQAGQFFMADTLLKEYIKLPIYMVRGNHEVGGKTGGKEAYFKTIAPAIAKNAGQPADTIHYTVTCGEDLFIFVDGYRNPDKFLRNTLKNLAKRPRYIFLVIHQDVIPQTQHFLQDLIKQLLTYDGNILNGHTHRNRTTRGCDDKNRPELRNIIDHNIVAVAGSLWYSSGFGGPQIGSLGEPAGCKIFTIDSTNIEWRFKATQYPADKQFTCFDMNSVCEYFRTNGEVKVFRHHYPKRANYAAVEENTIMVNVWDWANDWKISIKENGVELPVKRKKAESPLMLVNIDIPNTLWLSKFASKNNKQKPHPHMFHAVASSADSTIEVTVTDAFGNVYTETMERPKQFHRFMK